MGRRATSAPKQGKHRTIKPRVPGTLDLPTLVKAGPDRNTRAQGTHSFLTTNAPMLHLVFTCSGSVNVFVGLVSARSVLGGMTYKTPFRCCSASLTSTAMASDAEGMTTMKALSTHHGN